jgi:hypothetical protein
MGYGGGEDEEEDSGMRRKVWDGMKVLVFVCVVLPRLTGVERGEEAECVGLRWTLVWTSWTGMCRPKERERAQRKGEGRATHAVPTNGPRRRCTLSGCQRQGDAINVIIGQSAVIILHAVRESRTGPQMGQDAQPRGEEGSVFQTVLYVERFHHASRIYLVVGSCPACSALMIHRSNTQ